MEAKTAGILSIIAGVIELLVGIGVAIGLGLLGSLGGLFAAGGILAVLAVPIIIVGIVAIVGGIYALQRKVLGIGARRLYLLALRPLGYSGDTSNYIRQHREGRVQVKLGVQPISNVKLSFSTCYVITSTAKQFEIPRVLSKLTNYVKEGDNVL